MWGPDWPRVRDQWILDPAVAFLNHGSFGACPKAVLETQAAFRDEMERRPVEFLDRRLPPLIATARDRVAAFLGADPSGLAFVPNATAAVATVLANTTLEPGDEILLTDHAYPAVRNAALRTCRDTNANLVVRPVPLPLPGPDDIAGKVLSGVTSRTRLVIFDHVASPTGAIFPVDRIVSGCRERGVPVLVDAAHGPGMLDIGLQDVDPDFWTGNFHKWACAPKGSAALVVAPKHRAAFRPLVTSHGLDEGFHAEFDWTGTADPTAYLSIPAALDFMAGLGWERVRAYNHSLASLGRSALAVALNTPQLVPETAFGSMSLVALPDGLGASPDEARALQALLYRMHRIEVPFVAWNGRGYVRLSAQVYNRPSEYERLADVLPGLLEAARAAAR